MVGRFRFRVKDSGGFRKAIKQSEAKLFLNLRREMSNLSRRFLARLKLSRLSGRPGLKVRTGALRRSFSFVVRGGNLATLKSLIFSTSKYAPTHEFGTVGAGGTLPDIVPVQKKWLTIPVGPALTPAGVSRFTGAQIKGNKNFFLVIHNPLRGTIFQKTPTGPVAVFLLRRRVAIPKRLGFFDLFNSARFRSLVDRRFRLAVQRSLGPT